MTLLAVLSVSNAALASEVLQDELQSPAPQPSDPAQASLAPEEITPQPSQDLQDVVQVEGITEDGESVVVAVPYADISPSYGVGTTYVDIFAGLAAKLDYGVHYVYYRESQYEYCFAYSAEMLLDGTVFTAPSVSLVTYDTRRGTYQDQPTYTVSTQSNFRLDTDNYLVWSDLGDYPELYDREVRDYAQLA